MENIRNFSIVLVDISRIQQRRAKNLLTINAYLKKHRNDKTLPSSAVSIWNLCDNLSLKINRNVEKNGKSEIILHVSLLFIINANMNTF